MIDDLGRRPGGLFNTVRLGLRLARAGGKVRMALVVVGATLGAIMILLSFSVQHALDQQWQRALASTPYHGDKEPDSGSEWIEHEDGSIEEVSGPAIYPNTALDENSTLLMGGTDGSEFAISGPSIIRYLTGDGPVPPGLKHIPQPGQAYLSPALIEHVSTTAPAARAVAGMEVFEIAPEGLQTPGEYLSYIGADKEENPELFLDQPPVLSWGINYGEQQDLYNPYQGDTVPIFIFMLAPATVLLATTTRLASSVRTERMAALRLIGVSRFRTRLLAGIEAGTLAVLGVVIATVIIPFIARLTEGKNIFGMEWFASDFRPSFAAFITVVLFVPLLTVITSLVVLRKISNNPLQVRRKAANPAPSWWRLLPLLLGAGVLVAVIRVDLSRFGDQALAIAPYGFLAGTVLLGFGVLLSIPVVVRRFAGLLGKNTSHPTLLLAARRTQYEPAVLNRLVSALVLVLFIATGGQAVILAFENTPQYRTAFAATSGTHATLGLTHRELLEPESVALTAQQLEDIPDVSEVEPIAVLQGKADFPRIGHIDVRAVVATCSDLVRWGEVDGECFDKEPMALTPHLGLPENIALQHGEKELALPTVEQAMNFEPTVSLPHYDLIIPPKLVDIGEIGAGANDWLISVPSDPATWKSVEIHVREMSDRYWVDTPQTYALEEVANVRFGIWLGTGIAGGIAIITLLITAIDNSIARRPQIAMQRAFGVSLRRVRRSQVLQALLPLAVGVPLAGAAGILAGQAYISVDGAPSSQTYWGAIGVTLALAAVAAVLIAAATLPAIGGKITGQSLRRE